MMFCIAGLLAIAALSMFAAGFHFACAATADRMRKNGFAIGLG